MFCSNQYYEKPWNLRGAPPQVKKEGYFHSKDDLLNSLNHTSPKQASFFLTAHKDPIFLNSVKSTPGRVSPEASLVPQRTLVSQNKLMRRTLERELLQLKSNQRILVSGPCSPPNADHCDRFTDYKDPSHSSTTNFRSPWERLNEQPLKRVKLTVTPTVLQRDRTAIEDLQLAIAKEEAREKAKRQWYAQNRRKLHTTMNSRREENKNKEDKAGIKKERVSSPTLNLPVSDRIAELSQPHQPSALHLRSDFSGLIMLDYVSAAQSAYRVSSSLPPSRFFRSNSKFFPLPERLGTGRRSVLSSRKENEDRPATVKTQNALIIPKPKETMGDEMMSRAEVLDSLKDIEDFTSRVQKETTVAFSKIHFSTFKDGHAKPR